MADTSAQLKIEKWFRSKWLKKKFKQEFFAKSLDLNTGGQFDFDAVSADGVEFIEKSK